MSFGERCLVSVGPAPCLLVLGHAGQHRSGRVARVCGFAMPQGEVCARSADHQWEHRSRYAMDNALRMATGRGM